jgi:hypothetical protein
MTNACTIQKCAKTCRNLQWFIINIPPITLYTGWATMMGHILFVIYESGGTLTYLKLFRSLNLGVNGGLFYSSLIYSWCTNCSRQIGFTEWHSVNGLSTSAGIKMSLCSTWSRQIKLIFTYQIMWINKTLFCASVVWWSELLATDPEVPGLIPGASSFSEKQWVWNGVHSASWGQLRSYLGEIVAAPVKKTETNGRGGSVALTTQHPLSAKVGTTLPTSGGRSVGIVR